MLIYEYGNTFHILLDSEEDKIMKETFTRTLMMDNEKLQKAKVSVDMYDTIKYTRDANSKETTVEYTGLTAWDIINGGKEAEEIEKDGLIDPYHSYFVLHFNDGSTATFRNSYNDLFIF
jgi:uncharacterized protein Veg